MRGARDEAGFALVSALWILVLLSVIAASAIATSRTDRFVVRASVRDAELRQIAAAGVALGIAAIAARNPNDPWPLDGTPRTVSYAGYLLDVALQDEFGKVDLNAASEELLKAVIAASGVSDPEAERIADAIADWRDGDDARRLHGAEKEQYVEAGLPYAPRNGAFESVAELGQVLGVSRALVERVAPLLTVYSRRSAVDPTAAPAPLRRVLADLAAGVPGAQIGTRAEATQSAATGGAATTAALVDLTGRAFTVTAALQTNARRTARATIRFTGDPRRPFWVHDWKDLP